jgi:hypothetical protein
MQRVCFVCISEKTAIIALYNIHWLVFFNNWDGVCLLRGTSFVLQVIQLIFLYCLCHSDLCGSMHVRSPTKEVALGSVFVPVLLFFCFQYTRWFKYDRDKLWLVYTQIVPVIFEPPCISTNALYSSASTCFFSQKDKCAKPGNLINSNAVSEILERWIEKYFHSLSFGVWRVNVITCMLLPVRVWVRGHVICVEQNSQGNNNALISVTERQLVMKNNYLTPRDVGRFL